MGPGALQSDSLLIPAGDDRFVINGTPINRGREDSLELRQIDCFLAVATDLHFGKAAERLSVAQSSVSEAIRALEHEVGGPLFTRTSRRVQLTPLGEKFRLGVE